MTPEIEACQWNETDYDAWETECGRTWCFEDGGPDENGVRFCFHCGKPVDVHPWTDEEDL